MINYTKVNGNKKDNSVLLYALSTCVWCKKTKNLLDSLDIDYTYVYVDLLAREEQDKIEKEIYELCPQLTFPTTVINGETVIAGFNEEKILKELGK